MKKYGLNATGKPYTTGSEILKIAGTIEAFPAAFSCFDLLLKPNIAIAPVTPDPVAAATVPHHASVNT
ncbi:hypothetical protein SDC9_119894 [bioreactor metagenome]|uniref:Uncharacterized protein n=1 Tax=bioreactor metagenome TaxID=1076179 RepID=A0A645C6C0_9ZZZZ